jgi:hypothetical protein
MIVLIGDERTCLGAKWRSRRRCTGADIEALEVAGQHSAGGGPAADRDLGSSYSGGHVLVVARIDRRVKAVLSQVPLVSGQDKLRALVRADLNAGFRDQIDADRLARSVASPRPWLP